MFLRNDWLEQIYPDYILLLDALLCHIWRGAASDLKDLKMILLAVIVFCNVCVEQKID